MDNQQNYILIDDDPTNNLICDFTIKKYDRNADVKVFQEPEKALNALSTSLFRNKTESRTIIFLDINMPTMTGFQFIDSFQQFPSELKNQFLIYILTSSIEEFTEQARRYPIVSGFISKPLRHYHLVEIYNKNLEYYIA